MTVCAGMAVRRDLGGVSSFVRALGLDGDRAYHSLLRTFSSSAIDCDLLVKLWLELALRLFDPMCVHGRLVLICDGIVVPKEGRRMPGVKLLHQSSTSNAKAEFVMGHSIGAISLGVVGPTGKRTSVPIGAEIHDGIIRTHRGTKTTVEKMAGMAGKLGDWAGHPAVVVADSFYASRPMIRDLGDSDNALVSRVRSNAVAYEPPETPRGPRKRGRPRIKGEKIPLSNILKIVGTEGELFEEYRYVHKDLYWPPAQAIVRFVATQNNTKGSCILVSTDLSLTPTEIIGLYRCRWSIECGFKTSKHVFGTFGYHFWSKTMSKQPRRSSGTRLVGHHREFRARIEQKVQAFHLHMALGSIAHGLATYFSLHRPDTVWRSFGGWVRSINRASNPSEAVVSEAMKASFSEYLRGMKNRCDFAKFISGKQRNDNQEHLDRVA